MESSQGSGRIVGRMVLLFALATSVVGVVLLLADYTIPGLVLLGVAAADLVLSRVLPGQVDRQARSPEERLADLDQRLAMGQVDQATYDRERARLLGS